MEGLVRGIYGGGWAWLGMAVVLTWDIELPPTAFFWIGGFALVLISSIVRIALEEKD